MSIQTTLYASGTLHSSACTLQGGASSVDDAIKLQGDGKSVDMAAGGGNAHVDVDNYTIPAGDMIKSVRVTFQFKLLTAGAEHVIVQLDDGTTQYVEYDKHSLAFDGLDHILIGTAILGTSDGAAFTQALINSMTIRLQTDTPVVGGPPTVVRWYAAEVDITVLAPPTVTAIAPAGSITARQPIVSWTFVGDTVAGFPEPQTYARVKVFRESDAVVGGFNPETSGAAVWDSNDTANGTSSMTVGAPLDAGIYRLYVKAAQIRKHWSPWAYSSVTIVNLPNVPSLTAPPSGAVVDTGAGFRAAWTYTHPDGTAEASWALRRATDGGAYQYWRDSDSTWQATIQWISGATVFKDFLGAAWPNNHTYAWAVAVKDSLGAQSDFGSDSTIVATAAPTAGITAPSGTITTTTRPAITWTYADGIGRPQSAYQVKVFLASDAGAPDGGTPFYDSGVRAGSAGSLTAPVDFPADGTAFVAYVKVMAGGQWSDWDSSPFNCTITAPAIPVSITAVEQTATNAVLVTVTGAAEGSYTALRTVVERLDRDGVWRIVRGATALVPNGAHVATVTDYEMPARVATVYRAKIFGTLSGGGIVAGVTRSAAAVTPTPTSWWLKDVADPTRNVAIPVADGLAITHPVTAGVFDTYGDNAIVISELTPRSERFQMSIWTKSAAVKTALDAILDQTRVLLVQDVLDQQWYVQIVGDMSWHFLRAISATLPREHAYSIDVPVAVVDRPAVS